MSNIIEVTDANFKEAVEKSEQPVLVDFWAPWCGPCKTVAPMLEAIADEFGEALTIAKVNVDDSPEITAKMRIRSIPTLALFDDGGMVAQKTGAGSLGELRTFVKGNL
ncbi:thioredoxin [Marinobacter xestospongiae]|uniref:thioredoxin n=1 Tax=Marinobacter xestospongiae TaxID=994319 RepID=UPI0020062A19|nr:thioredoxin [Marinobacter xestospongiae]MCK7568938.1 thioredoxin [Marinobacter xestospongiae]